MRRHQPPVHFLTLPITPVWRRASSAEVSSGEDRRGTSGLMPFFSGPRIDDRRPAAREEGVEHQTLGALGIADPPPSLEFADDLHGQSRALEHPQSAMILGGGPPAGSRDSVLRLA